MLKPALARGELHVVGATTLDEYRKHIEKDAALERRFQPVYVEEPSVEATIAILRGLKERYEVHYGARGWRRPRGRHPGCEHRDALRSAPSSRAGWRWWLRPKALRHRRVGNGARGRGPSQ